jgi:hypothetical protein
MRRLVYLFVLEEWGVLLACDLSPSVDAHGLARGFCFPRPAVLGIRLSRVSGILLLLVSVMFQSCFRNIASLDLTGFSHSDFLVFVYECLPSTGVDLHFGFVSKLGILSSVCIFATCWLIGG